MNMDKSYKAPSMAHCWNSSNLDFADYLRWASDLIKRNRQDLSPETEAKILEANLPFEYSPDSVAQPTKGILLVHGLLSSPLSMQDIALCLKKQGFLVRSVLLPGHGTHPTDFVNITIHDWLSTVEFGLNSLARDVGKVWLGGLSGGADLALCTALNRQDIQGLVLFAPSLKLKNPLAPLTKILHFLNDKLRTQYWPERLAETDYAKYCSYSIHFARQAYELTCYTRRMIKEKKLSCPLWMALTEDDETICSNIAKKFFMSTSHPRSQLLWYAKNPLMVNSDKRIIYRSSQFLDQNILDFSHGCLTFSPQNKHYGQGGDYQVPLHQPRKGNKDPIEYRGALTRFNLKHYNIRRITYNPDFQSMIEYLIQFLNY